MVAIGYTASDLRLGGTGDDMCPTRVAVRHLGLLPPLLAACFGVFSCFVFVFFSCFTGHSLLVFGSNFMRIFVG